MYLLTVQELLGSLIERYESAPSVTVADPDGEITVVDGVKQVPTIKRKEMVRRLRENPPKTEREAANILGNDSWTELRCDNCRCRVKEVICFDNLAETATTCLCGNCVKTANLKLSHRRQVVPNDLTV